MSWDPPPFNPEDGGGRGHPLPLSVVLTQNNLKKGSGAREGRERGWSVVVGKQRICTARDRREGSLRHQPRGWMTVESHASVIPLPLGASWSAFPPIS